MVAQGWKFDADQKIESSGLSFACLIAHRASNKHSIIAYTIVVGDEAYALMFLLSENVATDDSEFRSVLRSFRLLSNKV
jgi:predicted Zn-dependent protease